jgi:hypothetical protein
MNTPITKTQGDSIVQMKDLKNKDDCFRIYYTDKSELVIEFYNGEKFDALYQSKIPNKMLATLFGIDYIYNIYENIINTINRKEYIIKDINDEKKLFLKKGTIALRKIQDNCYFGSIFKKILEEKEKEILNKDLKIVELNNKIENLQKKLNHYNSQMKNGNSQIKNGNGSQNNMSIKRFNTLYNASIDINEPSVDLGFKDKGNDLLMNLSGIHFNCLKELSLRTNKISDINPFKNMNLDKLQTLNLYNNKVQDLSPLINADLIELKKINLQKNHISDISPLMKLNCIYLEILLLNNNHIEDITPLTKVKFAGLQKLTLDHNLIRDISALEYVPFVQLKILSLHHNPFKDIKVFEKIINNLKFLESLWLYQNDFKNNNNDYIINILSRTIKDFL